MSDFDANEFLNGIGEDSDGDTDLVRNLRRKVKDAAKQLKEVTAEVANLKQAETTRTLTTVWEELKVPEAVRKFYTGEPTADAVKTWVEENKAVFNLTPPATDAGTDNQGQQTPEQQAAAAQLQQQMQNVQQAASLGFDQPNSLGLDTLRTEGSALAQKPALANMAALDEYLAKLGFSNTASLNAPQF